MASERGEGGRTALVVEGTGQAWSIEEVGRHSTDRSNWLVVHGRVYDVTTFISKHPGGPDILLELAGRDVSSLFEELGHSTQARELMQKYCIGTVAKPDTQNL